MTSASQTDLPEDQLVEMLARVKSSRETDELRARLPAQLAPFASNISIVKPIQTVCTAPNDGIHYCACTVNERKIYMSITVVPSQSQDSDSEEPQAAAKPLQLVWRDWWTTSRSASGSADSRMHSISFKYCHGKHSKVTAFTGWYDDPGTSESECSHGGIKSVVEKVARDMGFREGELDNEVEVLEALLGNDGRQLLEGHAEEGKTLRKIIEDEIEEEDYL